MSLETFHNLPEEKQNVIIQMGLKEFASKSYAEASTDHIIKECGISKGILFHYFGSKKNFYIYLLEYCLRKLTNPQEESLATDFYQLIFDSMERKMELYDKYPKELLFVSNASKETNRNIEEEKNKLLSNYMIKVQMNSHNVLERAVDSLILKEQTSKDKVVKGLSLYVNTIVMSYLEKYKDRPEDFFKDKILIKKEVKEYIDLILYGVKVD